MLTFTPAIFIKVKLYTNVKHFFVSQCNSFLTKYWRKTGRDQPVWPSAEVSISQCWFLVLLGDSSSTLSSNLFNMTETSRSETETWNTTTWLRRRRRFPLPPATSQSFLRTSCSKFVPANNSDLKMLWHDNSPENDNLFALYNTFRYQRNYSKYSRL